jgi:hypothetical protein
MKFKLTAGRARSLKSPGILGVALSGVVVFGLTIDAYAAELRISDTSGKSLMVVDAPEGSSFRVEARGSEGKSSTSSSKSVFLAPVSSSNKLTAEFQSGVSVFNNIGTGEYVLSTSDIDLKITSVDAIPSTDLVSGSGTVGNDTSEKESEASSISTSTKAAYVAGAAAVAGVIGAGASSDNGIFSSSSRGDSSAREGSGGSSATGVGYNAGAEPRSGTGNVGALANPTFDNLRPLPGSPAPNPSFVPTATPTPFNGFFDSSNTASPVPSVFVSPAPSVIPTPLPQPPVTNPMTPS